MYTHLELFCYRDNYDDYNTHYNCTNLSRIQAAIKWTVQIIKFMASKVLICWFIGIHAFCHFVIIIDITG